MVSPMASATARPSRSRDLSRSSGEPPWIATGCERSVFRGESELVVEVYLRGIPAASLKHVPGPPEVIEDPLHVVPRGIPAASLKPPPAERPQPRLEHAPRGIPAASSLRCPVEDAPSRGIPAASLKLVDRAAGRLPRGIPAASLKRRAGGRVPRLDARLPRGIPAASLKLCVTRRNSPVQPWLSSAGNTRGLIEAQRHV